MRSPSRFALRAKRHSTILPVETSEGGWLLVQAKNSLSLASSLNSELGKTVEQIVTQWHASSVESGERGWNRPLDVGRDRLVIAVGANVSGSVTNDLAKALASTRANHSGPLPTKQLEVLVSYRQGVQRDQEENLLGRLRGEWG
jgi:hypothetical protein